MSMIVLRPIEEERDGGKGTRAILAAMADMTRIEIERGREEVRIANRQMWNRFRSPRQPNEARGMNYRTSIQTRYHGYNPFSDVNIFSYM